MQCILPLAGMWFSSLPVVPEWLLVLSSAIFVCFCSFPKTKIAFNEKTVDMIQGDLTVLVEEIESEIIVRFLMFFDDREAHLHACWLAMTSMVEFIRLLKTTSVTMSFEQSKNPFPLTLSLKDSAMYSCIRLHCRLHNYINYTVTVCYVFIMELFH